MKIMNRLTIRFLKENKRRTILTILCISMSIVMLSCIGIGLSSGKLFYKDYTEKNVGDYHYIISSNNIETLNNVKNYDFVEKYFVKEDNRYFYTPMLEEYDYYNDYLDIVRGDRNYFIYENVNDYLIEGRIPNTPSEIILSKKTIDAKKLNVSVGEEIELYVYDESQPVKLKVVGIIDDFEIKNEYQKNYDGWSCFDSTLDDNYYEIYVTDKDVSNKIFDHGKRIIEDNKNADIMYHSSYLAVQDILEENSQSYITSIYSVFSVLVVIIIFVSVIIINQAFNLSINDRIKYLGMLSSVGSTPKQKRKSIYFEGVIMSLISIPLGLLIAFLGLFITFSLLNNLEIIKNLGIALRVSVSFKYIIGIVLISLLTISISLYIPAKKVSKITVIDSLRNNDNIKVKEKKMKNSFISRKIMSFPTQLAFRNYKRQGRQSKFIIISLVVSMIAFVSIFSFGSLFNNELKDYQRFMDHDISIDINSSKKDMEKMNKILDESPLVENYNYEMRMFITGKIDKTYYDVDNKMIDEVYDEDNPNLLFIGLSTERIKDICKESHIDYNERYLYVNPLRIKNEYVSYKKMDKKFIKELSYQDYDYEKDDFIETPIEMDFFDDIKEINNGFVRWDEYTNLIIPIDKLFDMAKDDQSYQIQYYVYATDSQKLDDYLKSIEDGSFNFTNEAANQQYERQMLLIVKTFIYGFVAIMILFTILNMINIMNSSIYKRKKEFAMMMSVGISPSGLRNMILKESFIYGFKTLLYGLPLSIFVESRLYNAFDFKTPFTPSYLAYFISFITIVIIMIIVFRVSLNTLNKQNIIESLKEDM